MRITKLREGTEVRLEAKHAHAHGHGHDHHPHGHTHPHEHAHAHEPLRAGRTTVSLEQDILAKNNLLAQHNRGWFEGRSILALNLVSAPGAGKTAFLVRTLKDLSGELPMHVIEGDQATTLDASRIHQTGCNVVQINTGTGCHLDAHMLAHALEELQPPPDSVVLIENVGNLVCPSLFDLGEYAKVCIVSVTEGEDKPLKYPHMFRASDVMVLNKMDLLAHVDFDLERCLDYARQVNPDITTFQVSATRGDGMDAWYAWLREHVRSRRTPAAPLPG